MIDILLTVLITALFVNGLIISTGENMILEPVKKWIQSKIGERMIYKPLIGCVKCMPSIYGTLICLCLFPADVSLIYQIPIVIACSSTVSTIIHQNYI